MRLFCLFWVLEGSRALSSQAVNAAFIRFDRFSRYDRYNQFQAFGELGESAKIGEGKNIRGAVQRGKAPS